MAGPKSREFRAAVNIRDVFRSEELDFTPWLAENLDRLGDELGLTLEHVDTHCRVGRYEADVIARETNRGVTVVIENQLTVSDHSHFGQLLTYAGGESASILIWVAESFTDEHCAAVDALNTNVADHFEVLAVQIIDVGFIGDEPMASFRPVAGPKRLNFRRRIVSRRADLSRRNYTRFFRPAVDTLRGDNFDARPKRWLDDDFGFRSGIPGVWYCIGIRPKPDRAQAYLMIDSAEQPQAANIFGLLEADAPDIKMEWSPFDAGMDFHCESWKARGIPRFSLGVVKVPVSIVDENNWNEVRDWLVRWLVRVRSTLQPRLEKILRQLDE